MSEYCSFCHMTIAPGDSSRVTHQGRSAHRHCIIRRQDEFRLLCIDVNNLMVLCRLPQQNDEWHRQYEAGRITGYDGLVQVLRCCFRRIDNWRQQLGPEGPYTWPTADLVDDIRDQLSQRLFCNL